jgi:tetratricopeptide repeat protein 21B
VLELLSRFLGAHPEAQLLYARTLYLNGSLESAARKAANILGSNHNSTQAALLVVSVHLRQGRAGDAMVALEAAVVANFAIRDTPLYHVVHAQVLMASGQLEEARKVSCQTHTMPCRRASCKEATDGRTDAPGRGLPNEKACRQQFLVQLGPCQCTVQSELSLTPVLLQCRCWRQP